MPITPHFVLSQTESTVNVDIRVPHVRVSAQSVEVVLDGSVLHFSSPPYLLILNLPAPLVETTNECATYDPSRDGGTITLVLQKQEAGIWKDLDMMGSLMTPKQAPSSRPANMSIVSSTTNNNQESEYEEAACSNQESSSLPDITNALRPHYGFLNQHVAVFTDLAREGLAAEMLELPFPDETLPQDRREMRIQTEQSKFDADRYLGDLDVQEDYIYQVAMTMSPHWMEEQKKRQSSNSVNALAEQISQLTTTSGNENESDKVGPSSKTYFTQEETAQLASIPYPLLPEKITTEQTRSVFLGLLDILFAYVYDHILTDGDPTVESSWTVCILSCTLSWLEEYDKDIAVDTVMINSIRRALIYPYLRNYKLALHCWRQVACILQNGRRCVIRSLLQIRSILDKSECHYLGNRLYIDPYLAWIQRNVTDESVAMIQRELDSVLNNVDKDKCLGKDMLGLNLVQLEHLAEQEDGSQSSNNDSASTGEEETSSDEESESESSSGDEDTEDKRPVPQTEQAHSSSSNTSQEAGAKVQRHSTELLDCELPKSSGTTTGGLDGICSPLSTNATLQERSNDSRGEKETQGHRPLIEEI